MNKDSASELIKRGLLTYSLEHNSIRFLEKVSFHHWHARFLLGRKLDPAKDINDNVCQPRTFSDVFDDCL